MCVHLLQGKKKKAGTGRRRDEHKSKGRPLDRRMFSDKRQNDQKVCTADISKPSVARHLLRVNMARLVTLASQSRNMLLVRRLHT